MYFYFFIVVKLIRLLANYLTVSTAIESTARLSIVILSVTTSTESIVGSVVETERPPHAQQIDPSRITKMKIKFFILV